MSYKILNIRMRKRISGSGSFSYYIKLNNFRGVKVLHDLFDTIQEAKKSENYKQAREESKLLIKAYKSGIVPKCYGVTILKDECDFYSVGILLQHLGNETLTNTKVNYNYETIYELLEDTLYEKTGIYHNDIHSDNIMVYKNKFWLIDFTPELIEVIK